MFGTYVGVIQYLVDLDVPIDSELFDSLPMDSTREDERDMRLRKFVEDINNQVFGSSLDFGDQDNSVLISSIELPGGRVIYE